MSCVITVDKNVYKIDKMQSEHFIYTWVGLIGMGILVGVIFIGRK